MDSNNYALETLAVHAGVEPDPTTGAVMTPIYQTSTYAQTGVNEHKGYKIKIFLQKPYPPFKDYCGIAMKNGSGFNLEDNDPKNLLIRIKNRIDKEEEAEE